MFEWYKKQRLNEQVKFFGGTQKGFVSCYAKQVKPRIKIKLEPIKGSIRIDFNPRYAIGSAHQALYQHDLFMGLQAQGQANMANLRAYGGAGNLTAGMGLAHNALSGGLGAAGGYHEI